MSQIGQYMYPTDNSYAIDKQTGEELKGLYLAGTNTTEAKLVRVVSEPYTREFRTPGIYKKLIKEFVDVEYEGKLYTVLNCLSETQPYSVHDYREYWFLS